MLKRVVLLSSILLSTILTANDAGSEFWKGCGKTKEEARSALAQNIHVNVQSKTSSEVGTSWSLGFESVSMQTSSTEKTTSTLALNDLESYKNEDGEECVKVNKKKLEKFTRNKHKNLEKDYSIITLPKDLKLKASKIDEWLTSLMFLSGLTEVFSDLNLNKVNAKIKQLQDIRKDIHLQSVTINLKSTTRGRYVLKIGNKVVEPSKSIYLKAKKYTFSVEGSNICKYSGEFDLEKNQNLPITVDLDEQAYPKFVISANKNKNLVFKFDGKVRDLGSTITHNKCTGKVNYRLEYTDGLPEVVDETISLEPNLNYNESHSFTSNEEIKLLNTLADSFNKANRLEIEYYSSTPSSSRVEGDFDLINNFRISQLSYNGWERKGFSLAYGSGSNESYSLEIGYLFAIQMPTFGAKNSSFKIGNFAVIVPYLGFQTGLAYMELYNNVTGQLENEFIYDGHTDSEAKNNYIIARPLVGFDVAISKSIALGVKYSKDLTLVKSDNIGFYLSLKR